MTSTSELGYWVTTYQGLSGDYPMSASVARWVVNNARHLVDESSQVKVNWSALAISGVGQSYEDDGIIWHGSSTTWVHVITHVFPIISAGTNTEKNSYARPFNLVCSLAGYTQNSDELFFRMVIQPYYRSYSDDFVDDRCLAYFEGSTVSNTAEWVIDGVTTALYPDNIASITGERPFSFTEYDDNVYTVRLKLLRATVYAQEGYAAGWAHLSGIHIREFQAI